MDNLCWLLFWYVVACVVVINQTEVTAITLVCLIGLTLAFGGVGFLLARSEGLL